MLAYSSWESRAADYDIRHLPDIYTTLAYFAFAIVLYDFSLYHIHVVLHFPKLYKYIHKIHHSYTAPVCLSGLYMHPVEYCLLTVFAQSIGNFLLAAPMAVTTTFFNVVVVQVLWNHSGYHLPLGISGEFHDYHHAKFHTSYGVWGFWDWFWGTDVDFVRTVNQKRHFRIYSTKSAREYFPDPIKPKRR